MTPLNLDDVRETLVLTGKIQSQVIDQVVDTASQAFIMSTMFYDSGGRDGAALTHSLSVLRVVGSTPGGGARRRWIPLSENSLLTTAYHIAQW